MALAFLAYSASAVLTPVALVIIARELALSLSQASLIEVLRSSLIVALLLASGFLAAHLGKARSIGFSLLVLGLGLIVYAIAPGYVGLLVAAMLIGMGGGVIEALLNPLVQDVHPRESGRYLNIANAFWSVGVLVTVVVSGDLLTRGVSWRRLALGLGVAAVVIAVGFFALHGRVPRPTHRVSDVWGHHRDILFAGRFWLFAPMMFAAGAAEGAFTFWTASYIQLHHGGLPRAGGVGTACFAAAMMVGRFASGFRVRQHHMWHLILASAALGLGVSLLVPLAASIAAVYVVLAGAGLAVACFWPSLQSYAADRMPVETTALFILMSLAGIPGFAFASWIMGVIADAHGLQASFRVVPAFFGLLAGLLVVERLWKPWTTRGGS